MKAKTGNTKTQYQMREIFRMEKGIPKNYTQAKSWHAKAAGAKQSSEH